MPKLPAILAVLIAVWPAVASAAKMDIVAGAVDDAIRPGYDRLAKSAQALAVRTTGLCADPSAEALAETKHAFGNAVRAWSAIEFIRFGPIREENRAERFVFFPDRRGVMLRQVQALLAEEDVAALDTASLADKSVAVQGLPALEYLLYGNGSQAMLEPGSYRCGFAAAISRNLAGIAEAVSEGWRAGGDTASSLLKPGSDNALYHDEDEALKAVLGPIADGYEMLEETRLRPFVGEDAARARPKRAIWWRSGLTREALMAGYQGLADLATKSGALEGLPGEVKQAVAGNFAFENRAVANALHDMEGGHAKLAFVIVVTESLREIAKGGILGGYGLAAGFSSLDGD
jgi:predicted lipoprotein